MGGNHIGDLSASHNKQQETVTNYPIASIEGGTAPSIINEHCRVEKGRGREVTDKHPQPLSVGAVGT